MIEEDRGRFSELITLLAIANDVEMPLARIQVYWMVLEEFEIRDVEKAVKRCVKRNKFMPRPSEIYEILKPSIVGRLDPPNAVETKKKLDSLFGTALKAIPEAK